MTMSSSYTLAVVIHVIVAVLGTGAISAVAVILATQRHGPLPVALVRPLLRWVRINLGLLVLTGIWMDVATHGALHSLWWVRGSFLLVIGIFVLLRLAERMSARSDGSVRRLETIVWIACGAIGVVAALMRIKPF
jgi:hypothetical protein